VRRPLTARVVDDALDRGAALVRGAMSGPMREQRRQERAVLLRRRLEIEHARAQERRERQRGRARRQLPAQGVVAVGAAVASLPADGGWQAVTVFASGLAALLGWRSLAIVRRPPLPSLPALPAAATPAIRVRRSSAAYDALRRLDAVREELEQLLPLVQHGEVAAETWQAAGSADTVLRGQAHRLAAVEPHRGADPALVEPLYAGVVRQEQLVLAVCDLVAASGQPSPRQPVLEAIDRLHALAQGMREATRAGRDAY